jgi:hypothetical protein
MSKQITITHERTDDIPVILAFLLKMRVAELIDKHFPTNGNWTGLSLGQMLVVWLTFIVSEGDHRLSHVEPWVAAHQHTLSRSLGQEVLPRDCTDDRLATGLDYLSVAALWVEYECERNQTLIRVYDLHPNAPGVPAWSLRVAYSSACTRCPPSHRRLWRSTTGRGACSWAPWRTRRAAEGAAVRPRARLTGRSTPAR